MERNDIFFGRTDWESIVLPIVLMITGAILVGGDYLGVLSLDRIQNFWPISLIAIGLGELAPWGAQSNHR